MYIYIYIYLFIYLVYIYIYMYINYICVYEALDATYIIYIDMDGCVALFPRNRWSVMEHNPGSGFHHYVVASEQALAAISI